MRDRRAPTASVVLGTYNGARYIGEQLESLLRQSQAPFEVIIADDGSSDDTLELARRLLRAAPFRVSISQNRERLGFRDNFLQAALRATGDYVAFCDQDDIWHPDKLKLCAQYFGDARVAVITHAATLVDERGAPIGEFRQSIESTNVKPPLSYDPWSTFWGFSIVFRRDLLDISDVERRFVDYVQPSAPIAHDRWVSFLGQMVGDTVEIGEPLVSYRQHGRNLFGRPRRRRDGERLLDRSATYIRATEQMIRVVEGLSPRAELLFPRFDRDRCLRFLAEALEQLEARHGVYGSGSRRRACAALLRAVSTGRYVGVHDQRLRVRSLLRDLQYVVTRR